jgi:hypothetical protein
MNMVAIPTVPEALAYMVDPPGGRIRGVTLLKKLNQCALKHELCRACKCYKTCEFFYDFLIESDAITNWKGANRNVTRYY